MGEACIRRVAVVTGARRGIGRGIALRLAAEGADVALVNRASDTSKFERTLESTLDELDRGRVRAVLRLLDNHLPAEQLDPILRPEYLSRHQSVVF